MKFYIFIFILLINHVDLHDENLKSHKNQKELFQRQKKYSSSRKKVLEDIDNIDETEKSYRQHSHLLKTNRSKILISTTTTTTPTTQNYLEEASLCINEYDIKQEQLVKVKELKNDAHMIRFIHIEEPSSSHGLDIKDICMLNCCVEKNCDLAMLSEQRTNVN